MIDPLNEYIRLRAFQQGRAQPSASHRRIALHPQALFFCPVVFAGEEIAINMLLLGHPGASPRLLWIPDPRSSALRAPLFEQCAHYLNHYYEYCLQHSSYPQIWVASAAAAELIDLLSDYLHSPTHPSSVQLLGRLLAYPAHRMHVAGQQCLLVAPHVLGMHWITGQDPDTNNHLAVFLTWLHPPSHLPLLQAIEHARQTPASIKTDPSFDQALLAPALHAYQVLCQQPTTTAQQRLAGAQRVRDVLRPIVKTIYHLTQQAYRDLQHAPFAPLPSLACFEQREAEEFTYYWKHIQQGKQFPSHDSIPRAIYLLAEREDAEELYHAVLLSEERVEQARGRLHGEILHGTICWIHRNRTTPRRFTSLLCLRSTQKSLRIRIRDTFYWALDLRLKLLVETIQHDQEEVLVTLRIVEGMRSVGLPDEKEHIDLLPLRPDWEHLRRKRIQLARTLQQAPWQPGAGGTSPLRASVPAHLLTLVEGLP